MVDAGAAKLQMSTRDTLIRSFMGGALLALGAVFAVTVSQQTGHPIIGAILFPVGFCTLYLHGYDLLTGVFVLGTVAWIDKRPRFTLKDVARNWGLVFTGNFLGALTVAFMMAIVFTFGFSAEPSPVGKVIAGIGEARTLGYKTHGAAGMLTLFVRGVLCNWMVSSGVVGAMVAKSVEGKVIAMWMPITLFFGMTFEHSVVNMFLFPSAMMMGGDFQLSDYLVWNELPTVFGNLVGGITFTGLALYTTHLRTAPKRGALEPSVDQSGISARSSAERDVAA
jgi:formate/nitrite transporter